MYEGKKLRTSNFVLKALLLASFGMSTGACSNKCLRHTDCGNGAECLEGACVILIHGDGSVAALTPAASESRPVDPAAPPATGGAPATSSGSDAAAPADAGIAPP